jgi:hypothetical protein
MIEVKEIKTENMVNGYALENKRNWFSSFLRDYGSYNLIKNGEVETVLTLYKKWLEKSETNTVESIRVQYSRMKKSIEEQGLAAMDFGTGGIE